MKKVVLAPERTRRALYATIFIVAGIAYFYEFPLYALLYCYDLYQGLGGLESGPTVTLLDGALVLAGAAIMFYIYWHPRDYVFSQDGGLGFAIIRKGKAVGSLSRAEITTLVIKAYSKRRTQSRDSEYVAYHKIYCASNSAVVFYDSVSSPWWRTEKRVVKRLERRIGRIDWQDKDGILGGAPSEVSLEPVPPSQEKVTRSRKKPSRTPPKVVKGYGGRLAMAAIFFGFSAAFWTGGYRVVAAVFVVISALLLLDLILALCGFGQQAK